MNDNRRQILQMLADRKITAEEAERLLVALESNQHAGASPFSAASTPGEFGSGQGDATSAGSEGTRNRAKYLRVQVVAGEGIDRGNGPTKVNIRVPMQLLRAGVRLASLIPVQAHEHLDEAFRKHGLRMTLSQIKPENLEELIDHLNDLTVDVDSGHNKSDVKVKVFSE